MLTTSSDSETVIIKMADLMSRHGLFFALIAGIILAGILAATMSQDIMHDFLGIKMNNKTNMLVARGTVAAIAIIALILAWNPNSSVFRVVSFAWAGFGATFGPTMLIALFWRRSNRQGALAGMIVGGIMIFVWKFVIAPMGGVLAVYELLPAFLFALAANVIVSLATGEPEKKVVDTFDRVNKKR